jgi:hypothetical protein
MKRSFLFLTLVLWSASYSSAQQVKTLNIAIIADKAGGLGQSPLISLLEVQLSRNDNIRLLERAQIDKILQEQQLSAAGLLDRNNTIKIGQLLRADALVIITLENEVMTITTGSTARAAPVPTEAGGLDESGSTTENKATGDLIRVRVAEAAHGLRLLDRFEQLDSSKLNEIAERIKNNIKNAVDKLSLPTGQLIPVGIVDIHRVQLGERYTMLERTLPKLLSVRLGLEPKIVMLEREDLKVLLDEKLRTQGEDSKFWASAVLIEGNLQPKDGGLEMSLSIRRPAGEKAKSFTVPVDPNGPSVAIDKAATNIVQEILNTPPSSQWQLAAEAEQFYQQGQMLANHQRYESAMTIFETAYALQPQNMQYSGSLFKNEWNFRKQLRNGRSQSAATRTASYYDPVKSYYNDSDLADIVSIFIRQLRDRYEAGQLSARDVYYNWTYPYGPLDIEFDGSSYFSNPDSVSSDRVRLINRQNRKIWYDTFDKILRKQILRPDFPLFNMRIRAGLVWISSDIPEELVGNLKKDIVEFGFPPEMGGAINSESQRADFFDVLFRDMRNLASLGKTQFINAYGNFHELLVDYLTNLTNVNDSIVKVSARLALVQLSTDTRSQIQNTQGKSESYKTIEILLDELKNFKETRGRQTKQLLLRRINDGINSVYMNISRYEITAIWEQTCNTLIDQNDITNIAYLNSGELPFTRYSEATLRSVKQTQENIRLFLEYYLLLDRVTQVLQPAKNNPQANRALSHIKDFQAEIKQKFPDLDIINQQKHVISANIILTKQDWFMDTEDIVREYELSSPDKPFIPIFKFVENGLKIKLQDEILWMTMLSGGSQGFRDRQGNSYIPFTVGLAGISLPQKKLVALWQAKIQSSTGVHLISDLSIGKNACYISIPNAGIIEFPGRTIEGREFFRDPNNRNIKNISLAALREIGKEIDLKQNNIQITDLSPEGLEEISRLKNEELSREKYLQPKSFKKPVLYTQNDGLPSLSITSMASDINKLWVAYGGRNEESGLGVYDPMTEKWETVFCSTLTRNPPFSNGQPYEINSMIFKSQNELLFNVSTGIDQTGLWKLNTDTRQLRYIWSGVTDIYKDCNNNICLNSSAYKIDPDSEKITMIIQPGRHQLYASTIKVISGLDKDLFIPESFSNNVTYGPYSTLGNLDLTTSAIHNNKLWARLGKGQIIIAEKGKSYEEAQIIENNLLDGKPVWQFVSTQYGLIAIGEGSVGLIETE